MRPLVVSGAFSALGTRLVVQLLNEGRPVVALKRPSSRIPSGFPVHPDLEVFLWDPRRDDLRLAFESWRPEGVFQLGALYIARESLGEAPSLIRANIEGPSRLVEAALSQESWMVALGTAWQHYGPSDQPVNLYAATKSAFQTLLRYWVEAQDLVCTTLEIGDTYGPDDPRQKLLPVLLSAQKQGDAVELPPPGQSLNLIHWDDVCRGLKCAAKGLLDKTLPSGSSWALRAPQDISLEQLVTLVQNLPGPGLKALWGARSYRPREVLIPFKGIPVLPGWQAIHSIEGFLKSYEV